MDKLDALKVKAEIQRIKNVLAAGVDSSTVEEALKKRIQELEAKLGSI